MATAWTLDSWRSKPIRQVPDYADKAVLQRVEKQLANFPPLFFAGEARRLREPPGAVGTGQAFLPQGGVCAARFVELHATNIPHASRVILQMAEVLIFGAAAPTV